MDILYPPGDRHKDSRRSEKQQMDFIKVWWDCVLIHYELWRSGIRYHNVTLNSMLWRVDKATGVFFGYLEDTDEANIPERPDLPMIRQDRLANRTSPFLALDVLRYLYYSDLQLGSLIPQEATILYRHGWESFIWILVWVCKLKPKKFYDHLEFTWLFSAGSSQWVNNRSNTMRKEALVIKLAGPTAQPGDHYSRSCPRIWDLAYNLLYLLHRGVLVPNMAASGEPHGRRPSRSLFTLYTEPAQSELLHVTQAVVLSKFPHLPSYAFSNNPTSMSPYLRDLTESEVYLHLVLQRLWQEGGCGIPGTTDSSIELRRY